MSRGDVKFVSHGSLEHRLEHLSCYLLGKLVFHRLADDILAYIFFLNATILEHATTVASSQVCYEMAVHCTQLSHDLEPYHWLSIIINILTSGLRHNLIVQVSRCWILAVGSTLFTVRLEWMKDLGKLVCSRFLRLPASNLEFVHISVVNHIRRIAHLKCQVMWLLSQQWVVVHTNSNQVEEKSQTIQNPTVSRKGNCRIVSDCS